MGQELVNRIPNPEILLSLEPEELGGILLPIFQARPRGTQSLNWWNYIREFHQFQELYPRQYAGAVSKAIMEAIDWMISSGLLVHDPDDSHGQSLFVTRRGLEVETPDQFSDFRQASLLNPKLLHPVVAKKAWPTFIRGKFDTAVFEVFKEVEVAVRATCQYEPRMVGVELMRTAFHPERGPLTDTTLPTAEREALMALFAGAYAGSNRQSDPLPSRDDRQRWSRRPSA